MLLDGGAAHRARGGDVTAQAANTESAASLLRAQRTIRALSALESSWDDCVGAAKARAVAQRRSVLSRWRKCAPHSKKVLVRPLFLLSARSGALMLRQVATGALKAATKARRHAAFEGGRSARRESPSPDDTASPCTAELQRCAREQIAAGPNKIVLWRGLTLNVCAAGAACKEAPQGRRTTARELQHHVGYIRAGDLVVVRPMVGPTARDVRTAHFTA